MTRRLITRLWPRTLTGQLVFLLLGAIILTHVVLGIMLAEERRDAVASERRGNALWRVAAISRILSTTPSENWADVLRVAQSSQTRLRLVETSDVINADTLVSQGLTDRLNAFLATSPEVQAKADILAEDACWAEKQHLQNIREEQFPDDGRKHDMSSYKDARDIVKEAIDTKHRGVPDLDQDRDQPDLQKPDHNPHGKRYVPWALRYLDRFDCHGAPVMQLAVPIFSTLPDKITDDGQPNIWLEAMIGGVTPPPRFVFDNVIRVVMSALVIGIITFFLARRISRSWAVLTRAADRVGRGDYPEPVPETGPLEIRRAAKAFNRMTARLKRFVEDRTRMLAAISHDLRTPITSLRLRAEFVEDPENRARIIETLNEMEQMVEAAMTFAREETANEKTRKIDIAALVESAVEDLAETGRPIAFSGEVTPRVYPCRPLSIKRAFGNLVSNALEYGATVEVAIQDADDDGLWIEISDDGPGIPIDQREQVFEPFFRLEESRNRDTGGIGLGMAIARTAIRAHGGEIYLEDAPQGGLLARIYLPPAKL